MHANRALPVTGALLILPLALASCSHRKHYHGPPVYVENEPNGSASNPDDFGSFGVTSHLIIEGHVQAFGPDQLDGFRFVAREPVLVEFELRGWDPYADPDLCVYDPFIDEFIACYDSPANPEYGSFSVFEPGQVFHLVVETFVSGTSYSLELRGRPIGYAAESAGPDTSTPELAAPEAGQAAPPSVRPGSRRDAYKRDAADREPAEERELARGSLVVLDPDGEVRLMPWRLAADER